MVSLVATPMAGTKDDNGRYQAFALSLPADYQANSSNPNKGSGFYVNGQVLNETTGTLQIIPPSFGANYTALVYHTSSGATQIPALDARDWVLDYFNGIFFQQDPPADSDENPAYVDAFLYIGDYALTRLTGSGGSPGGDNTEIQFNDGGSFEGSENLTFDGTTLTVAGDLTASVNISASAFYGDGSNLSGITTTAAGSSTQLQFNNSDAFDASANLTYDGSTLLVKAASHLSGGLVLKRTAATNDYSIALTDYYVGVDTTSNTVDLTVPQASSATEGQTFVIKDEGGNTATNVITILRSGSDTIDGATSVEINSPYGSFSLYTDGANWFIY